MGMSDVVNRMQGNFGTDRDHYMKSLMRPDLLILDDLGAERNTSFGKERVFDVVDKRLLTGKPMIVTTNIPLSVMKQAADWDDRRILTASWRSASRFASTGSTSAKAMPARISKKPQKC